MIKEIYRKTFDEDYTVIWFKDGQTYHCEFLDKTGEVRQRWNRLHRESYKKWIRNVVGKLHVVDDS